VLTRDRYDYPGTAAEAATMTQEHKEQQAKLAELSSKAAQIVVQNSGHHIQLDAPDAVIGAIKQVAEQMPH